MYNQSINNIKVIILPLDGVILDLNKYRYNYYNHMCNSKNITLDKHDFYSHLSNMYDMYKGLPLSQNIDIGPLNAKIERELSLYLKYKGIQPNEGIYELIEYLHQKDIKIAVLSTHHTKNAVEYLKNINIYNKVHFIIGSDTSSLPIPSTQILKTIVQHFDVKNEEVLVISPFLSLNQTANQLHMNIIFYEDLCQATEEERNTSYKTVSNLFDVLNILLFDRYDESQMYSSILGMDNYMSKDELDRVYEQLKKTYINDSQILKVVDQTYAYHVSQLQEHSIKDGSVSSSQAYVSSPRHFSFDDEFIKENKQPENQTEVQHEQSALNKESLIMRTLDDHEEEELTQLLKKIQKKDKNKDVILDDKVFDEKSTTFEELLSKNQEKNHYPFLSFLIELLSTLILSFLIIFIGIILSIVFVHQWESQKGIFGIILNIFNLYYLFIEKSFEMILNTVHSFLSFIPDYIQYSQSIVTMDGVKILNIYIFNTIIIGIMKIIYFLMKRSKIDDTE